ncbi:MAG: proline dehydrogenase [Candidatus Marinimicrobia bacterium]|nr:proline dehydrogenase [Candidatus Neomarinimicrobiota bacterium]
MKLLDTFIYHILKRTPKKVIKAFSKRYVAGFSLNETLQICKKLNKEGYCITLDILGEHTKTLDEANFITNKYLALLETISRKNINANISVKPSHIGHDLGIKIFEKNLIKLAEKAESLSNFIRIDMESSKLTDDSISTFKKLSHRFSNLGIVLQAYLFRSLNDLKKLKNHNLNFRLCKGIYKEPSDIAIQDKDAINKNYLKILEYAFLNKIYIGIATHDKSLLLQSYNLIKKLKIPKDNFEFQGLYGVPLEEWYKNHLKNNYKVRLYLPFGDDWYEYSLRRIKENPNIAKYVIKNLFKIR